MHRVRAALATHHLTPEIRVLEDSARTAQLAAAQLGVEVAQIASSLVFLADGEPLLVLTSGAHRVDTTAVAAVLGVQEVRRADAALVREHTGFAIGGVAPIGHEHPIRTLVDVALGAHGQVWAAAGHPRTVFATTYDELLRMTGGTAVQVN